MLEEARRAWSGRSSGRSSPFLRGSIPAALGGGWGHIIRPMVPASLRDQIEYGIRVLNAVIGCADQLGGVDKDDEPALVARSAYTQPLSSFSPAAPS